MTETETRATIEKAIKALEDTRDMLVRSVGSVAPAQHHTGVTPKGWKWTAWNCTPADAAMSGAYLVIEGEDRTIYVSSAGKAKENIRHPATIFGGTCNNFPNAWSIPAAALAKIDAMLDAEKAKEQPAPVKPWTFETMPNSVKVRHKREQVVALASPYSHVCAHVPNVDYNVTYSDLLENWRQIDGAPCGT